MSCETETGSFRFTAGAPAYVRIKDDTPAIVRSLKLVDGEQLLFVFDRDGVGGVSTRFYEHIALLLEIDDEKRFIAHEDITLSSYEILVEVETGTLENQSGYELNLTANRNVVLECNRDGCGSTNSVIRFITAPFDWEPGDTDEVVRGEMDRSGNFEFSSDVFQCKDVVDASNGRLVTKVWTSGGPSAFDGSPGAINLFFGASGDELLVKTGSASWDSTPLTQVA